jgi:G:T-mismatch repair DNA endonuclease (very short patch repair protein)
MASSSSGPAAAAAAAAAAAGGDDDNGSQNILPPEFVIENPTLEEEEEANQFYLDIRNSKSFKGSGWAEEKTYRVTLGSIHPDQNPSASDSIGSRLRARRERTRRTTSMMIDDALPQLTVLFENLVEEVKSAYAPNDSCRVYIDHPDLQSAIIVPPIRLGYLTAQIIMDRIQYVLTSGMSIPLNDELEINLAVVKRVGGQGYRDNMYIVNYEQDRKKKRCIVTIPSDDKFCLPKAILVANAYLNAQGDDALMRRARMLHHKHSQRKLTKLAKELMENCNIPQDREGGLEDIGVYERHLQRTICVLSAKVNDQKLYPGNEAWADRQKIYLYLWKPFGQEQTHFDVIRNMAAFVGKAHYCYVCDVAFDHKRNHSCSTFCSVCHFDKCLLQGDQSERVCETCHRTCRSEACYERHKRVIVRKRKTRSDENDGGEDPVVFHNIELMSGESNKKSPKCQTYCELKYKCLPCGIVLDTAQRAVKDHVCGEYRCNNCHRWFNPDETGLPHLCHMRSISSRNLRVKRFIFYDFECTQNENDTHIPNLVVAQSCCEDCEHSYNDSRFCNTCGTRCSRCDQWSNKTQEFERYPCDNDSCGLKEVVFRGLDVTQTFGDWLFSRQHRGMTVIAHNAKGYDNYFLYNYCLRRNMTPSLIFNGTKIVYMHLKKGINLRCLDSCSFLPMPLADLPQCFDLNEVKKGFFPHFYNIPEHYHTIRVGLPSPDFYGESTMSKERQEEFKVWYSQHCNDIFDFEQEMLDYCRSDVDILRRACLCYRDVLLNATKITSDRDSGIDPFGVVSAASVCMTVFRARFLPERWEVLLNENNPQLSEEANYCSHRPGACSCQWSPARKCHGDSPLEIQKPDGNWVSRNVLGKEVLTARFVESPIGIIPPSEYNSSDRYSQEAMCWLRSVQDELCEKAKQTQQPLIDHPHIQTALSPSGEKSIFCPGGDEGPGTRFHLDGYYVDPVTKKEIGLEFYGCHWHGCPSCYIGKARKDITVGLKSIEQRYKETLLREFRLRNRGLTLRTIWACEFKKKLESDSRENSRETCQCHPQGFNAEASETHVPLALRDAYFGGRTSALKHYHYFHFPSQGKYYDFTSLYPWALKYGEFPISHPQKRYHHQEPYLEVCQNQWEGVKHCSPSSHRHYRLPFFGIAKVKVLPPRNLLHPVLPLRCKSGKLVFPLCQQCAENNNQSGCSCDDNERSWVHTYCSGELEVALDQGYRIVKYYEILHWPTTTKFNKKMGNGHLKPAWDEAFTNGLFAHYVNAFLQIKQQASGYPSWVRADSREKELENMNSFISRYHAHEGIRLKREEIKKSSSLRSLAKLLLNSLYGKFGQRLNLRKTHLVNSVQMLCHLMSHPKHVLVDFHILSEDLMQIETENNIYFEQADLKTNVVIAAFTTSWARLKLWNVMHSLGERVFYTDTDSLIFESLSDKNDPPLGEFLGELADELSCKKVGCSGCNEDSHSIVEFVASGPKNYGFITNNGFQVCKVRGFSLNCEASKILNFETMKRNLLDWFAEKEANNQQATSCQNRGCKMIITSTQISRDKYTARVYNRKVSKLYGLVIDKQRVKSDFTSTPFGYKAFAPS